MEYMYSALLLHKLGKEINAESLSKVISAAGSEVDEAKVKVLVASLKGLDIAKELESASLAIASAPTTGGEAKAEAKEEKKEEKAAEAADGLASLFG